MDVKQLEGSRIKVFQEMNETLLIWKKEQEKRGFVHYIFLIFLLPWFLAWTAGGIAAFFLFLVVTFSFMTGDASLFFPLFTLLWLVGWACGEILVFRFLKYSLLPSKPSILTLRNRDIRFQTGTEKMDLSPFRRRYGMRSYREFFKRFKNRIFYLGPYEIETLRFDESGEGSRL